MESNRAASPPPPVLTRHRDRTVASVQAGAVLRPFVGRGPAGKSEPQPEPEAPTSPPPAAEWEATETGAAVPPWESDAPEDESQDDDREQFPLDAFIIPEDSRVLPSGVTEDQAQLEVRVAEHLEDIAADIRADGLEALRGNGTTDGLRRRLAAAIADYLGLEA